MLDKDISAQEQIKNKQKLSQNHKHCRKSLLFHIEDAWMKTEGTSDITVRRLDCEQICELISIKLRHELSKIIGKMI